MRTSSIKSLVSAVTIVATLTLAVPIAEARSAREPRMGRSDTIVRAVINLLKRLGRVTGNAGPSIPQEPVTENEGTPSTTTTGETVQQ